jgi:GT2 family glycosyltransferase
MTHSVCVNIVTWNSVKLLTSCLEALLQQTITDLDVVIVDNASDDGTCEFIEQHYPSLLLIQNKTNTGFCHAHNQAIRASSSEFVMPLNSDVVMTPTYIEQMLYALDRYENAGIACGKLYLPDGKTLDGAGLAINKARRQYLRGHLGQDCDEFDTPQYVFGADGAAPLYRRKMLDDIKLDDEFFDEYFFAHKEDLDLSWRAQLYGWKCIYVPTAIAYHDRTFKPGAREEMSDEVKLHAVKNRYLAILKNDLPRLFVRHLPHILWYDLKILGYLILFERSSLRGFIDLCKVLPRTLRRRAAIMKRRRVSSSYMLQWFR